MNYIYALQLVLLISMGLQATQIAKNSQKDEPEAPKMNLIESVEVKKNFIRIKINKEFKQKYLTGDFWAKYPKEIDLEQVDYSIQIMPFIMNVVSIVWISGHDYYIDSMDEELYASLERVKEVFRRMHRRTKWKGRLIPRTLTKNSMKLDLDDNSSKKHTALLFSGGLDSMASSLYHRSKKQLLITVCGHWDLPLWDKKLWKIRKKQLREYAQKYGHENCFIRSNYYSFLKRERLDHISREISSWRIFTVEGIGWAGLAAPVQLLKGYRELLHASTVSWDFDYPAAANPFVDNNIKFAGARLKHDLFDMNRLEKCEFMAQLCKKENLSRPYIRVCEERIVGNCCRCQKCIRTILELIVVGEDSKKYGFNIAPETILKKSKQFMAQHTTGYTTVWHFRHMQKLLQEKIDRGEKIPADLEWMLKVNLNNKVTTEVKNQQKINWHDFADLLPDMTIPESARR